MLSIVSPSLYPTQPDQNNPHPAPYKKTFTYNNALLYWSLQIFSCTSIATICKINMPNINILPALMEAIKSYRYCASIIANDKVIMNTRSISIYSNKLFLERSQPVQGRFPHLGVALRATVIFIRFFRPYMPKREPISSVRICILPNM